MIAGLVHVARVAMGLDPPQPVRGLGRQQGEVDADAVVPLPGAGLIVPEAVGPGRFAPHLVRVGQAQVLQGAEGLAALGLEQGVVGPGGGVLGVLSLGDDVIVAAQGQRLLEGQQVAGVTV